MTAWNREAQSNSRPSLPPSLVLLCLYPVPPLWLLSRLYCPQCECKLLISAVSAWPGAHTALLVCCLKSLIMAVLKIRLLLARVAQQITANHFAGKMGSEPSPCL